MDIRNNFDGLKSLLGIETAATASRPARTQTVSDSALGSDRATLSTAATEFSQAAREEDVRPEKVAAVQAALAAGTYNVPAAAVASRVVDAMLNGHK